MSETETLDNIKAKTKAKKQLTEKQQIARKANLQLGRQKRMEKLKQKKQQLKEEPEVDEEIVSEDSYELEIVSKKKPPKEAPKNSANDRYRAKVAKLEEEVQQLRGSKVVKEAKPEPKTEVHTSKEKPAHELSHAEHLKRYGFVRL